MLTPMKPKKEAPFTKSGFAAGTSAIICVVLGYFIFDYYIILSLPLF